MAGREHLLTLLLCHAVCPRVGDLLAAVSHDPWKSYHLPHTQSLRASVCVSATQQSSYN